MTKKDAGLISLMIIFFLGILLVIHTGYNSLVYEYSREIKNFSKLTQTNNRLKIEFNNLSSPERIINYAIKNLNLELPKADKIYFIEKK